MQLLIDTAQETPDSLRWLSKFLTHTADYMDGGVPKPEQPTINGPSQPVVLTPADRAIDPQPHFLDKILTDPAQMNPATVFSRGTMAATDEYAAPSGPFVPAGTPPTDPTLPALSPDAPVNGTQNANVPAAPLPTIGTVQAPPPPTAPQTVSGERDSDNLPWDERIHSETRKKNADGSWRYRRNLDAVVKAQVTAELKAAYGGQSPLTGVPAAPAPTAPPAPSTVGLQPGVGLPQPSAAVPLPPGIPMGVSNAPHAPVVPANNFRELMTKVNQALASGRLTQAQLTAACQACNPDSITALAAQPAMVAVVDAQINDILGAVAA